MKSKLRAWDKDEKEMLEVLAVHFRDEFVVLLEETNDHLIIPMSQVTLMQSTGLKDRNGIEIYEGDYLSLIDFEVGREYKGEIVFSRGSFCMAIKIKGHDVEVALYETTEVDSFLEVLGNICENPELLEVAE